jgi:outer membrane protein
MIHRVFVSNVRRALSLARLSVFGVFVVAACVASAQAPAPATTAARMAEVKIGVVNTEKLLRESVAAQRSEKKLEREFATRQAEVEKIAKRFRDASTAFDKEQLAMSDEARRNKQRELEALSRDAQRAQRELREDFNLRKNEELAQLQERAQRAIQRIAEAEKFDIILQDAVYVSSRVDITERVLKALAE